MKPSQNGKAQVHLVPTCRQRNDRSMPYRARRGSNARRLILGKWAWSGLAVLAFSGAPPSRCQITPTPRNSDGYTVVARGPHHRVWQRETWLTNAFNGSAHRRVNSYCEMATGMNRWSGTQWIDCDPTIQVTATGAQATNAQHQLTFVGNLNARGSVSLITPDDKRLTSNLLGLSYSDGTNSVFIAETHDSFGELLQSGPAGPGTEAIFSDAFSGCLADVIYENSISGFDQTIILREQLPSPAQWNMDPAATELQVITEFLDPPTPVVSQTPNATDIDDHLDFGVMQMGRGEAFAIGSETNRIPVTKRWLTLSGRQCLVEQMRFVDIEPFLRTLPPRTGAIQPNPGPLLGKASRALSLPAPKLAARQTPALKLARRPAPAEGFAMDYSILTSQANVTLQADTTYYISGAVTLYGTNNVIEGGCVIKLTNSPDAGISASSLIWKTGPYRPVVFTSKDDNNLGDTITGSTGNPTTNFYAGTALDLRQISSPTVPNARFCYLSNALAASGRINLRNVQFVNCFNGFAMCSAAPSLCNVLLCNVGTFLTGDPSSEHTLTAQNVTARYCTNFIADSGDTVNLTNCLFVCVTNWSFANTYTSSSVFTNSDSGIFQTVGAGSAYLAANSPYRNAGTTNIDTTFLAELATKTTYPPIVYTSVKLNSPLNLFPQAQRDNDTPDLGYHYDSLDFAFGVVRLTNAVTITVTPGTVVAGFATNELTDGFGLDVDYAGQIAALGSPVDPVRFVVYNTVQEQSQSPWVEPYQEGIFTDASSYRAAGGFSFRFADFSALAQHSYHMYISTAPANLQDCQFHGGWLVGDSSVVNATNCLFERVSSYFTASSGIPVFRNNTFFGGEFDFYPAVTNAILNDNIFDHTVFGFDLTGHGYSGAFNAYATNASVTNLQRQLPAQPTDIILQASPAYQTGPLGSYYQLSSSTLFNADTTTTADEVGLYHYTTITNTVAGLEIKETNSFLDVGYHHVAVDSNTNALDSDGGGAPDYLENAAGDGHTDNVGETNWQDPSDDYNYLLVPRYLRCEYRVDPWGITTNYGPPRLFWIVTSPRRAEKQVSYHILVASSTNNLNANIGDVWDTHEIFSDQTTHVQYSGAPLQSGQRLWWKISARDLYTGLTAWSTNAFFQIGLLSTNDWTNTYWLGVNGYQHAKPCPMFRSPNIVLTNAIASATIYASAKGVYELWVNGYKIGPNILAPEWTDYNTRIQYQTFDVGPYLTNGTPYSSNILGAFVGEGWCYGDTDYATNGFGEAGRYYGPRNPQFALRLSVINLDGSTIAVTTDTNGWTCSTNGPIRSASIYAGEKYDSTQEGANTNWCTPNFIPQYFTAPTNATRLSASNLYAQPNQPIQIMQFIQPLNMWMTTNNSGQVVAIYDLGQNIAGWGSLSVSNLSAAAAHATVYLDHVEGLNLDNSNVPQPSLGIYQGTLGGAAQRDTYIFNGGSVQNLHPHFTYHGFRYIQVTAPLVVGTNLTVNSITGCVIHSGAPITGGFACSGFAFDTNANWVLTNGLINKLVTNAMWGIRGNLMGVFTAVPQRQEREGYLGDESVISQTACFDLDMASFLTKWLRDIRDAQQSIRSDGGYTDYAPWDNLYVGGTAYLAPSYSDPAAQAGGIIFAWRLYQNYGDTRMLQEHYQSVTNHIGYLASVCVSGSGPWQTSGWNVSNCEVMDWASGDYFGWQGVPLHPYGWPESGQHASIKYPSWGTAWSAFSLDLAANMAQVLGHATDYARFTNLAAQARTAYTNSSNLIITYNETNIANIGYGSQSEQTAALFCNMIPTSQRSNVVWQLVNGPYGIANYNNGYTSDGFQPVYCTNHLSTGYYFAAREMMELTRDGYNSLAYQVLLNTNLPSWLYPVIAGSTTCWESPNSYLAGPANPHAGYNDRGYFPGASVYYAMTSLNCLAFGAVSEWLWKVVGGINPDDSNPGFKNTIIQPQPGGGVTNAVTSFDSIHGPVVCSWTNSGGTYSLTVVAPADTTALIYLPSTNNLAGIVEGGTPATNSTGVLSYYFTNWPNWSHGATVFQVGSGAYTFTVTNATF